MKKTLYETLRPLAHALARFFYRVEFDGQENVPDGPFILCANHQSMEDVVMVGLGMKKQLCFMAKKELFSVPLINRLIRNLGAYPVARGSADLGAIRRSIEILQQGGSIVIFPQGTRCPRRDPLTTPLKNGAVMIAHRAGVPILPVYLDNKNYRPRLFRPFRVVYGKPLTPEELGIETGAKEELNTATARVMDVICSLPRRYSPPRAAERTDV